MIRMMDAAIWWRTECNGPVECPDCQIPLHPITHCPANDTTGMQVQYHTLSDQLFFTNVVTKKSGEKLYSGFSLLAELLRHNKDVARQLLANADQEAYQVLFAPSPKVEGRYRRLQLWGQRQMRKQIEAQNTDRFDWVERDVPLFRENIGPPS